MGTHEVRPAGAAPPQAAQSTMVTAPASGAKEVKKRLEPRIGTE
jgi:hypothetical protein